jgi:molecular chaperone GrpE
MADEERSKPAASPAVTDPPPSAEAGSPEELQEQLETLKRERDDYYDRLLRKTAEFDNYRKRIDRERREQANRAVESLLQDLLQVADDFDRALAVDEGESVAAYRKGIELIHTKLHDMLRRLGVKPIVALGEDFDPNLHQAVAHEPSADSREGEVIAELRRGYTIGDRLLRPAMVKVAKA